jgi:hypothetical protein
MGTKQVIAHKLKRLDFFLRPRPGLMTIETCKPGLGLEPNGTLSSWRKGKLSGYSSEVNVLKVRPIGATWEFYLT